MEAEDHTQNRHPEDEQMRPEVRAEIHFPESVETRRSANQDRQDTLQKLIAGAAWAAFFAAVAYAWLAQRQLGEMKEQTAQIYHQSEVENSDASWKAVESFRQLNIAQTQAKAAQDSVDAIKRNMEVQQRAWVGPIPVQPVVIQSLNLGPPNLVIRYQSTIKNFGPSPALNVTPVVEAAPGFDKLDDTAKRVCNFADAFVTGKTTKVISAPATLKSHKWGNTLFPGSEHVESSVGSVPSDPKLTVLYLVGCIAYRDQFRHTRHTHFCVETPWLASSYTVGTPLVPCSVYNDTD
jgi:hypothetical protein